MKPYYERDGIQLFHCDCRELLPTLADCAVDRVVTSPPYNLGTTTGGGFPSLGHYDDSCGLAKRGGGGKWAAASRNGGLAHGYGSHDDAMPHDEYVAWQKEIIGECWRVLSATGAIFYNHKPRVLGGRLVAPFEYVPSDLPIRQVVIWKRAGGINFSPAFYLPMHEWVVVIARDGFRLKSKGASGVGDVWEITQEMNNPHPAPFPLELPLRILETAGGATVLDPFGGSATTGVAAYRLGMRCILFEKHEPFAEMAAARLDREISQGRLFQPEPVKETQTTMFSD